MFKEEEVLKYLDSKDIDYKLCRHQAVATIKELEDEVDESENILKNLFLRDRKKKNYFLLISSKHKSIDLKDLGKKLEVGALSLGSSEDLEKLLGLHPGEVSPLGLLNDREFRVELLVDRELREFKNIGIHPNNNRATIYLGLEELEKILANRGHKISYVDL